MLFKDSFAQNPAMRFLYEHLPVSSSLGRNELLAMPFMTDLAQIEAEYDLLDRLASAVAKPENTRVVQRLRHELHQANDIRPTLRLLAGKAVLDDIQLFEIKKNALTAAAIALDMERLQCPVFKFDSTDSVVALLDPEHTRVAHFYIYAAYDSRLAGLRAQVKAAETANAAETLKLEIQQIEDEVRARLSGQLRPFAPSMEKNISLMARLDVLLAKARMADGMQACRPRIGSRTELRQVVNPEVAAALEAKNRHFQPVDISFGHETVLVTGANMAGKSVLLKTVSLAQFMFQFAFYVPAKSAVMTPVDEILSSIGDRQSEVSGLSSFAVEILAVDHIVKEARAGRRILALVDELARTTNPEEGKRLVNGFILTMNKLHAMSIVTTHYSGITAPCRRLRVKGLQIGAGAQVTAGNIADFMDYGLVETEMDEVPKEAFTIARLFDVDEEFLAACGRF